MVGQFDIDTDGCESYAQRLDEIQRCYQVVRGWGGFNGLQLKNVLRDIEKVIAKKAADKAAESFLSTLGKTVVSSAALLKQAADITCKINSIMETIALIQDDMGDECIIRLKNHYRETARRVLRVENEICSRGDKLFDL